MTHRIGRRVILGTETMVALPRTIRGALSTCNAMHEIRIITTLAMRHPANVVTIDIVFRIQRASVVVATNSIRVHIVACIERTTIHKLGTFPSACTAAEMTHRTLRGVISEAKVLVALAGSILRTNGSKLVMLKRSIVKARI